MSSIEPADNEAQYDIVRLRGPARRLDDLIVEFKEFVITGMAAGWNPAGGVAVFHRLEVRDEGSEPEDLVTLLQAMVRYKM